MIHDLVGMEEFFTIPFEQVKKNLRKILEDYGVSKKNCEDWLNWNDFYFALLDRNGNLSKDGADLLEYWKDYIGDPLKEMDIEMFVID